MKHIKTFESFINEDKSYTSTMDGFTITLSNVKKDKTGVIADTVMKFETAKDIDPFLENELDNYNTDIMDWAESEGIIKGDFSVGFDTEDKTSYKVTGNTITGTFHFWSA